MSFDRVAAIYDATRNLPPEVSTRVAQGILEVTRAGPETRFLELGVGTGRIALPVAGRGVHYTGVDVSERMLEVLREKAGREGVALSVQTADVTALPFADDSFEVVLAIHVLHLVPQWRAALDEARRVTVPDGFFIFGGNRPRPDAPGYLISDQWLAFAQEAGAPLRAANGSWEAVQAELTARGCRLAVYRVAQWAIELRPIDLMEQQRNQTFSHSWEVPEEILQEVHERMLRWGEEKFGDLSQPLPHLQEFHLIVTRWPE